jgi:hypothetical protein
MPHHEWIASRTRPWKPTPIDGVSAHAQYRVLKRLGVKLPVETWEAIYKGICADLWAWVHSGRNRIYHVPVEVQGRPFTLPLVVANVVDTPVITTAFDLLRG